ncbi:p102 [Rhizobium phage 16-3]|uniref:p102 n=1 Tax=Rhizobium phage 16-3 TaxID=10704 RepID=UPI00017BA65F|nr:p102 [Rhizobium phage 16-3]ABF71348.1 p102 [Rhizobium phage 16-3]
MVGLGGAAMCVGHHLRLGDIAAELVIGSLCDPEKFNRGRGVQCVFLQGCEGLDHFRLLSVVPFGDYHWTVFLQICQHLSCVFLRLGFTCLSQPAAHQRLGFVGGLVARIEPNHLNDKAQPCQGDVPLGLCRRQTTTANLVLDHAQLAANEVQAQISLARRHASRCRFHLRTRASLGAVLVACQQEQLAVFGHGAQSADLGGLAFPLLRSRIGDFDAGALAGYGSDDADALACDAGGLGLAGGGFLGHGGLLGGGVVVGGGYFSIPNQPLKAP